MSGWTAVSGTQLCACQLTLSVSAWSVRLPLARSWPQTLDWRTSWSSGSSFALVVEVAGTATEDPLESVGLLGQRCWHPISYVFVCWITTSLSVSWVQRVLAKTKKFWTHETDFYLLGTSICCPPQVFIAQGSSVVAWGDIHGKLELLRLNNSSTFRTNIPLK